MKKTFTTLFLFGLIYSISLAQQDKSGSKDHPLLSRYEGSYINAYMVKQFEVFEYPTSAEMVDYSKLKESKTVEGEITFIEYVAPEGVTATQVYRTYQTQLTKAGFKTIFTCMGKECGSMPMHFSRKYLEASSQLGNAMVGERGSYIVASGTYENEPYILSLIIGSDSRSNSCRYAMSIVKLEELDTEKVDVSSVTDMIETEGRYAFYGINFDLNSASLKEDSGEALQVIADYLAANSQANVLIVGHTDNTGDFKLNLDLSQKRAEAVIAALVDNYGVNANQMTPVGVGMASPVATNSNEDGRAANRRVELVLK
ncbi:outer membrane protein OmpA-like peptidoglycan-associated protein [Algoriphagus sp. 4150]|uniref:OmpA family protein n=1 Tax=Algoriphagus sp. 4150 TaxID=2817756 RepID=UPI002865FE30|nr:DUF4892 domain-containing protein [Algoriphagus sp. 4150]MDR7131975.1 outer membrane protein OmpA-like peptidoglycan-associated protein [Algoriphagus sp. 4150]